MKRKLFYATLAFIILLSNTLLAEGTKKDSLKKWSVKGATGLGFSQVALSNWSAGGDNSYSLNSIFNLNANRTSQTSIWQNNINLGYGIQRVSGNGGTKKINDQIILNSQYGYKAAGRWYYSARANLQTQFANGYDYSVTPKKFTSQFFAPAYLVTSIGMEYVSKDSTLSIIISPVSGKFTFVHDTYLSSIGAFGVTPGHKSLSEFGALIAIKYKKENLVKNVNVESTLQLFSNYNNHPENIDVNWQLLAIFKVNKYLSTTLSTNLIYYDKVLSKIQFKEILSIGLAYSF